MADQEFGIESFFSDVETARERGYIVLSGQRAPKLGGEYGTLQAHRELQVAILEGDALRAAELAIGITDFELRYGASTIDDVPTVIHWPDQAL